MIELIAGRMAEGIKQRAPEHPVSIAVLKHSLAVLINTFSIITLTVVIALITNKLSETIIVMISFALLRMVSGGMHLKSGTLCVVVSTALIVGLSFMGFSDKTTLFINIMSLILAILFAPTDIQKQSRIPKKYYPVLKLLSISMISINFLLASSYVAVAFFAQALLLIPRVRGGGKRT